MAANWSGGKVGDGKPRKLNAMVIIGYLAWPAVQQNLARKRAGSPRSGAPAALGESERKGVVQFMVKQVKLRRGTPRFSCPFSPRLTTRRDEIQSPTISRRLVKVIYLKVT